MNAFRRSGGKGRKFKEQEKDAHRVNHHIRVPQVRVIDDKGEQLGVLITKEA